MILQALLMACWSSSHSIVSIEEYAFVCQGMIMWLNQCGEAFLPFQLFLTGVRMGNLYSMKKLPTKEWSHILSTLDARLIRFSPGYLNEERAQQLLPVILGLQNE
jgi:hypothetical protein